MSITLKKRLLFSFLMSLLMSTLMSLVMVYIIVGPVSNFAEIWGRTVAKNFLIGFFAAFIVSVQANKITDFINLKFFKSASFSRKVIFALVMPAMMDFIMATVSTLSIVGFSVIFFELWVKSYFMGWIVAIPIVFFIAPLVAKIVSRLIKA